jgi:hypothetical protein
VASVTHLSGKPEQLDYILLHSNPSWLHDLVMNYLYDFENTGDMILAAQERIALETQIDQQRCAAADGLKSLS